MLVDTARIVAMRDFAAPQSTFQNLRAAAGAGYVTHEPAVAELILPPDWVARPEDALLMQRNAWATFHIRFDGNLLHAGETFLLRLQNCRIDEINMLIWPDDGKVLGESYHDREILALTGAGLIVPKWDRGGDPFLRTYPRPPVSDSFPFPSAIVLGNFWSENYFHWMVEVLSRLWYREAYPELADLPILFPRLAQSFQYETLEAMGVIGQSHQLASPSIRLADAWLPSLRAPGGYARRHVRWLKDALFSAFGIRPATNDRRIFVSRARAQRRRIRNEHEVLAALKPWGFEPVQLETLPLEQQLQLFSEASVVVMPHGAAGTNVMFMPPGSRMVELLPQSFPHVTTFLLARLADCRYGCLTVTDSGIPLRDLSVDIATMERLMEQVMAA